MAHITAIRFAQSRFRRWPERFPTNCSHGWERECTEFTSNRKGIGFQFRMPVRNYFQPFHLYPQTTVVMHRKVTAIILNSQNDPCSRATVDGYFQYSSVNVRRQRSSVPMNRRHTQREGRSLICVGL